MLNEHDLLRLYMKYSSNTFHLKGILEKSILNFFENSTVEPHTFEVRIEDNGKYIILNNYGYFKNGEYQHIPLQIIKEFCILYGVTCESITKEVTKINPLNEDDEWTDEGLFTILFEDIRDYPSLLIDEVLKKEKGE